jgi:hypothetical protein
VVSSLGLMLYFLNSLIDKHHWQFTDMIKNASLLDFVATGLVVDQNLAFGTALCISP